MRAYNSMLPFSSTSNSHYPQNYPQAKARFMDSPGFISTFSTMVT